MLQGSCGPLHRRLQLIYCQFAWKCICVSTRNVVFTARNITEIEFQNVDLQLRQDRAENRFQFRTKWWQIVRATVAIILFAFYSPGKRDEAGNNAEVNIDSVLKDKRVLISENIFVNKNIWKTGAVKLAGRIISISLRTRTAPSELVQTIKRKKINKAGLVESRVSVSRMGVGEVSEVPTLGYFSLFCFSYFFIIFKMRSPKQTSIFSNPHLHRFMLLVFFLSKYI